MILGPPDVGKTVLLRTLAGQLPSSLVHDSGSIRYGGERLVSSEAVQALVGLTVQNDLLLASSTPRETLDFIASLLLPDISKGERSAQIESVLDSLGILHVADTIVGTPGLKRGLSGGERKRANISRSLITSPPILLCDSPTDGLDTPTALGVLSVLRDLAVTRGITVVASLAQPSAQMFHAFDSVVALAPGGRVAYAGKPSRLLAHFASIGYTAPQGANPAELVIDVLSPDEEDEEDNELGVDSMEIGLPSSKSRIDTIVARASELASATPARVPSPRSGQDASSRAASRGLARAGPLTAFLALMKRNSRSIVRNKVATLIQLLQSAFLGILLGTLYFQLPRDDVGARDRIGFVLMVSIMPLFSGLEASVAAFMPERAVFLRESREHLYGIVPYAGAKLLSDTPVQILATTLVVLPAYLMAGLRLGDDKGATPFFVFVVVSVLLNFLGSWLGLFLSTLTKDEGAANVLATLFVLPGILFVGIFPRFANIASYLVWLKWTSFLRPAFQAVLVSEMDGLTFTCSPSVAINGTCPVSTGNEILTSLQAADDGSVTVNILVLSSFVLLTSIFFLFGLFNVRRNS